MKPRHPHVCASVLALVVLAAGAVPGDEAEGLRFSQSPAQVGQVLHRQVRSLTTSWT
jgi:hypothetical protein